MNARELELLYSVSIVGLAPYVNQPYFSMNLTNKPIEYLMHGLPILTTVRGHLSDLLEKYEMGFFYDIKSGSSFAERVNHFYNEPEFLQRFSNNCIEYYQKNFCFETRYQEFLRILKSLRRKPGVWWKDLKERDGFQFFDRVKINDRRD